MFGNKRAQSSTMTLEELVKIILGFIMFLFIVMFLVTLYLAFTSKAPSTYEADFLRVKTDIESFTTDMSVVKTPIFSEDINFAIIKTKNTPYGSCGKEKFCLCYKKISEAETSFKCEDLSIDKTNFELNEYRNIKVNHAILTITKDDNKLFLK